MKKQFLTVLLSLLLACALCSVALAEDALAKAAAGTLEVLTETGGRCDLSLHRPQRSGHLLQFGQRRRG